MGQRLFRNFRFWYRPEKKAKTKSTEDETKTSQKIDKREKIVKEKTRWENKQRREQTSRMRDKNSAIFLDRDVISERNIIDLYIIIGPASGKKQKQTNEEVHAIKAKKQQRADPC